MFRKDNRNINIAVETLINIEMKKQGGCLLKIGSCNIHIVHNGFKKGTVPSK